ncbi:uncharacterized, partial [Lates japonicus]
MIVHKIDEDLTIFKTNLYINADNSKGFTHFFFPLDQHPQLHLNMHMCRNINYTVHQFMDRRVLFLCKLQFKLFFSLLSNYFSCSERCSSGLFDSQTKVKLQMLLTSVPLFITVSLTEQFYMNTLCTVY